MSVDDHARKRWHLNETTGESETITRTVPRTQMIKYYFEACAIDVHNQLRQDGLGMENAIGTSKWWFRLMCTIFGMIEVDTFKIFYHFNRRIHVPSHINFIERLHGHNAAEEQQRWCSRAYSVPASTQEVQEE